MEKFDEQLDKFLRHQMSAEEEELFISELENKPELMERAQTIALAISEIQNVASEKEQEILQEIKRLDEKEFKTVAGIADEAPTISLWRKVVRVAVAACMVGIVALGGYKYNQYNQTVLLGSEYEALMISEHTRGGEYDNVEKHLSKLFARVNKDEKDLDEVIIELLEAYNYAKTNIEGYDDYLDDISWNLSVAYLLNGDKDSPVRYLKELIENNEGKAIAKQAQDLLDKIRKL